MLEFIKYLGGKFLIFGFLGILAVFVIVFSLGSYDVSRRENRGNPSTSSGAIFAEQSRGNTVNKISAREAAEALLGKNIPQELFIKNTTEKLAENISKKIVSENPAGPGPVGKQKLKVPNPQELVNNYLQKSIDGFDYAALKPKISDSEIKITDDASPAVLANYLKSFFEILNKVPANNAQADVSGALSTIIAIHNNYLTEYYALAAPLSLVNLHKQQISLLAASRNIYELVRSYEDDPLKAMLAMKAIDQVRAETAWLYNEVVKTVAGKNI